MVERDRMNEWREWEVKSSKQALIFSSNECCVICKRAQVSLGSWWWRGLSRALKEIRAGTTLSAQPDSGCPPSVTLIHQNISTDELSSPLVLASSSGHVRSIELSVQGWAGGGRRWAVHDPGHWAHHQHLRHRLHRITHLMTEYNFTTFRKI